MSTVDDSHKLKNLLSKRSSIKSRLTVFHRFIDNIDIDNISNSTKLKQKLERLIEKQKQYDEIQSEIEIRTENADEQLNIGEDIEDLFDTLISRAKELLITFENSKNSDIKPVITIETSNIKLPPIDLPTFDGHYINWRSFEDAFCAFVDKNESLSDVQKLCYLRSQLKGEAFDLIKSLETTAQNYMIAFNLIRERFNHHRRIVYSHINSILNIKYTTAKSFINSIDQHMQSLHSLNISLKDSDALLIPLLVAKLEPKLSREWEIKTASLPRTALPNYVDFRSFMLLQSETHDIINESKETTKHFPTNTFQKLKVRTNSYASFSITCPVCNGEHFIYQCSVFLRQDPQKRINTVNSLKLCSNCLRKGHSSHNCKSSKCKTCGKTHNTLLHRDIKNPQTDSQETIIPQISLRTINKCSTETSTPVQILLPTAEIYVFDKQGNKHIARALLDSASQSNFITQRLVDKLGLETEDINMTVTGINQGMLSLKHKTKLIFESKHIDYTSYLSCVILDKITQDLPHLSFMKDVIPIPDYIQLADDRFNEPREVDLLLGAEVFWDLILEGQIKPGGKRSPILQNTKLGWVISGFLPFTAKDVRKHLCTKSLVSKHKFQDIHNMLKV